MSAQGLVEEPVTLVASYTDANGLNRLGEVKAFAAKMGRALRRKPWPSKSIIALSSSRRLAWRHKDR